MRIIDRRHHAAPDSQGEAAALLDALAQRALMWRVLTGGRIAHKEPGYMIKNLSKEERDSLENLVSATPCAGLRPEWMP